LRTSAIIMNNSQMQAKLSTTFKAEVMEVEHTTVFIFPSGNGVRPPDAHFYSAFRPLIPVGV
jgi:hypothetical protein